LKSAVIVFPASNCDRDAKVALERMTGQAPAMVWHPDTDLPDVALLLLPGGFSYGDYLRTGAIARFSPVMNAVKTFAEKGGLVLGICNGFQILCEAHLLPGALVQNSGLRCICREVHVRVERTDTPYTRDCASGDVLRLPIAHHSGRYIVDDATLNALETNGQVILRYCDSTGAASADANPNGSVAGIAGLCNSTRNVFGLMPHPERAAEPILGSDDGRQLFDSLLS